MEVTSLTVLVGAGRFLVELDDPFGTGGAVCGGEAARAGMGTGKVELRRGRLWPGGGNAEGYRKDMWIWSIDTGRRSSVCCMHATRFNRRSPGRQERLTIPAAMSASAWVRDDVM